MMFTNSDKKPGTKQSIRVEKGGLYNPELVFVHPPEGWTGNRVNSDNQFVNIDTVKMPTFRDVLRWKMNKNPQEQEKKTDTFAIQVVEDTTFLHSSEDVFVWLGHSTFYIRVNGISLITDPIFYDMPLVKRHHKLAFDPKLITGLNFILVSHNHRDHCDKKSLKLLAEKNPNAVVLTGLEMNKLLEKWIPNKIQVAGWYQKYQTPEIIKIVFLPAQHWSKRGLTDTNKRLWGSYSIQINNKKFYFGGDTGWGNHFSHIGKHFGPFDLAFLPIGAYSPRWFMKSSHIDPSQAVNGFNLLNSKKLVPMHYGSYDLSDEPMGEPLQLLKQEFDAKLDKQNLLSPAVGQVKTF